MKKILLLTTFVFNLTYSQVEVSGVISFVRQRSATILEETSFNLHFNNKFSFFEKTPLGEKNENLNVPKYIREIFDISPDFEKTYFLFNLDNNKFYFKSLLLLKYAVAEDDLRFKWEIKSETKTILGYQCQRAISTVFRGRSYEAWFASKIPIPFGPWKANGLPGMILEFYDLDRLLHFKVNKISLYDERTVDFKQLEEKIIAENPLSIEKYVLLKNKLNKEFVSRIESRLPKSMGSITSYSKTEIEMFEESPN